MIPLWLQACIYQKIVCSLTSLAAIHFYGAVNNSREHLKQSTLSRELCFFHTALIVAIHYIKRIVVASRKFEEYCVYLRKAAGLHF